MVSEELKKYVILGLYGGLDPKNIRNFINKAGWPEEAIDKVFDEEEVRLLLSATPPEAPSLNSNRNGAPNRQGDDSKNIHASKDGDGAGGRDMVKTNLQVPEIGPPPSPDDSDPLVSDDPNVVADLDSYTENSLREGFSESSIRNIASRAGWSDEDIDMAMASKDLRGNRSIDGIK